MPQDIADNGGDHKPRSQPAQLGRPQAEVSLPLGGGWRGGQHSSRYQELNTATEWVQAPLPLVKVERLHPPLLGLPLRADELLHYFTQQLLRQAVLNP